MISLIKKHTDTLIISAMIVITICWIGAFMEYVHHMFSRPL